MHEKMVESCIVCAETESLSSIEVLKTLQDSIDCGLRSLGKDRTVIVTDGHCLLYAWARGLNVTKCSVEQLRTSELLSHSGHYPNFLTGNSMNLFLEDYLIKKIYKIDDLDILLSALSNAFQSDVTPYQYHRNIILVDKPKPGYVEGIENINLFYHNEHYKLVLIQFVYHVMNKYV